MTSENALQQMWDDNKQFLWRLLLGMTRDIDLTDDLLQETYINARAGIGGYRGGNAKAWLAMIARNAFRTHLRRRYVRSEVALDEQACPADGPCVDYAAAIDVRQAISKLPEKLRAAILMRHYAGYNYEEIAARCGCPVGTAKRRVNMAVHRLRVRLAWNEEEAAMKCGELTDRILTDYLYGKLDESHVRLIEAHIGGCKPCAARVKEISLLLHVLDAAEGDLKVTSIIEIAGDGSSTTYVFIRAINTTDKAMDVLNGNGEMESLDYVLIGGEEARMEPAEPDDSGPHFKLYPAAPIQIGEHVDIVFAIRSSAGESVNKLDSGEWEFGQGKLMMDQDYVYVMAVRLPPGAKLSAATPEPNEVHRNGATTVLWKNALPANGEFEFSLRYTI